MTEARVLQKFDVDVWTPEQVLDNLGPDKALIIDYTRQSTFPEIHDNSVIVEKYTQDRELLVNALVGSALKIRIQAEGSPDSAQELLKKAERLIGLRDHLIGISAAALEREIQKLKFS